MNLFELAKKKISGESIATEAAKEVQSNGKVKQDLPLTLVDEESLAINDKASSIDETKQEQNANLTMEDNRTSIKMNENEKQSVESNHKSLDHTCVAPCPLELEDTGLSEHLLLGLMLKHLQNSAVLTLRLLANKMALSGGIVQQLIDIAKGKSLVENYSSNANEQMRYSLSSIGSLQAEKELLKNGYVGSAPVPLSQYTQICLQQSSRQHNVTLSELHSVFAGLTFSEKLLEKIGPSLNSTKPILIYGEAGTGKSYFCRHLNLVFGGDILIPHAIEVNEEIIQVYDPEIHHPAKQPQQENILKLATSYDPRWVLCKRPVVVSGGELTAEMLEVRFDPTTKTYRAPLQLKANNGILLLDDLGRQKITPKELFNRWIIPLEERRDFLSLQSGLHFEMPFELLLLFSTNLSPIDLVDDAFLRRLGYKIQFEPMSKELYQDIWFEECIENNLLCEINMFEYLVEHLHKLHNRKFLPCYPRDLICIVVDQIKFKQLELTLTKELLDFAWHSYFVK